MINVTKTYLPDLEKYKTYLEKIYQSGWLTNHGECAQTLTKRLETHLGVKNLILVANATLGLQIAYKALGLSGEVITTPFSFAATTSSLLWAGLKPNFVDINPSNFCIDEAKISAAITPNTSAILPVHVYGNVGNIEHIETIAQKYKLKVIYDAAHSFGVTYKNQSILNYGDISVLSFHATKLFHTAEGGALIIKDDTVYQRALEMINFGFDANGKGKIQSLGINAKMSELHAAFGLCILDDLEHILRERKRVNDYYKTHLSTKLQHLQTHQEASHNYAYVPVIFKNETVLLNTLSALAKEHILPRRYFHPSLNTLPYLPHQPMPVSEDIASRVVCLPIYPTLSDLDLARICTIINTEVDKNES